MRHLFIILAVVLLAAPAAAQAPASPLGRWRTVDHDGVIEIAPCRAGSPSVLCGTIVGVTLDHPGDPPPVDVHGRPQCGLTIITGAARTGPNMWQGHITDPEDGKTYSMQLWISQAGTLKLHGYIGLPLFGQTRTWTRFRGVIGPDCRM